MRAAILFGSGGELGNRLVGYSHLLAFALEYRAAVCNLTFWRYAHHFAKRAEFFERPWRGVIEEGATAQTPWMARLLAARGMNDVRGRFEFDGELVCSSTALSRRVLDAMLSRLLPLTNRLPALGYGLQGRELLTAPPELAGNPLIDAERLTRHADLVRSHFELAAPLRAQVAALVSPLREKCSLLVGVHIRRGDYANYRGGRWLYELAVYERAMRCIEELHPEDRVGFLIAAKEPLPPDAFSGLVTHRAPGHLAVDLYGLAACDYIVGPPSTFSGWASFVKRVPYFPMDSAEALPGRREEASVWTPQYF